MLMCGNPLSPLVSPTSVDLKPWQVWSLLARQSRQSDSRLSSASCVISQDGANSGLPFFSKGSPGYLARYDPHVIESIHGIPLASMGNYPQHYLRFRPDCGEFAHRLRCLRG